MIKTAALSTVIFVDDVTGEVIWSVVVENASKGMRFHELSIETIVKMNGMVVAVFKGNDLEVAVNVIAVVSQVKLVENITKNVSIDDGVFQK